MQRKTPRVALREPRPGRFGEEDVRVLELGLGGAKLEHASRFDVHRAAAFTCGPLHTDAIVRHSVVVPAQSGVVYHTGIAFTAPAPEVQPLLLDLLIEEARAQVAERQAGARGEPPLRPPRKPPQASAVGQRFLCLRHARQGWMRVITADPNQPVDGITIPDGTAEEEIDLLRKTYERAGDATRELMRRMATVAILEQLRG